jgi:hypothetical protein
MLISTKVKEWSERRLQTSNGEVDYDSITDCPKTTLVENGWNLGMQRSCRRGRI